MCTLRLRSIVVLLVLTAVLTVPALAQQQGPRIEPIGGGLTDSSATEQTTATSETTTTPESTTASQASGEPTTPRGNESGDPAYEGTCADLGPFSKSICNGMLGAVKDIAESFLRFAQDTAEWAVEFLVSRPVPLTDGDPEFVDRPTNAPMDTVYDLWLTLGLPAGLALWALFMLGFRASVFLPGHIATARQAKSLELRGWLALFGILGSWIWCAFLLHLASGLTVWFAPAGEEIVASFEVIVDSALAAGLGAILLAFSSGVLFLVVALVFGLSWLAVFVLIPAMPVFIALSLPAFSLFRPISSIGRRLRGLFAPSVFVPFPAAVILGVGYPVINAIHASLDTGLSSFAGVDSFAYIILVLAMWFCAVVSPIFLYIGSRRLRPLAALTAGALGAATGSQLASRSGGLRDRLSNRFARSSSSAASNAGARVDPLEGSPFTRNNSGGFGGGLSGETPVGALGSGSERGMPETADSGAGGGTSENSTSGSSRGQPRNEYAKTIPDGVQFERVEDRAKLDQRKYDAGYFDSGGEYRSLSDGPSSAGWLLDEGGFNRIAQKRSEEAVVLYDDKKGKSFDVRNIVQDGRYRAARYDEQHESSVRDIGRTRDP
ncbi:type IV secretion system protein [Halorussus halophilus]|uniref:type IV secretion system protein n=1 Tax=Halorussus halophilus TaxID=2650975 RepID=UPI0013015470|nr:type IV secretion system protein [Halorussus halophilus]